MHLVNDLQPRNIPVIEQVGFVAYCNEGNAHHGELWGKTPLKGVRKKLLQDLGLCLMIWGWFKKSGVNAFKKWG